jgi:hypothetical protein
MFLCFSEFDIQLIGEDQSEILMTLQNNVTIKEFTLAFWYQNTATDNSSHEKFPSITLYNGKKDAVWIWEGMRTVIQNMRYDILVFEFILFNALFVRLSFGWFSQYRFLRTSAISMLHQKTSYRHIFFFYTYFRICNQACIAPPQRSSI